MVLAFLLLAAAAPDWIPARWYTAEPASLELLQGSPINCLLLEEENWSAAFAAKAKERGTTVLGVLHPGEDVSEAAKKASAAKVDGLVLEGEFENALETGMVTIRLPYRSSIRLNDTAPVVGTYQGVWPGINVAEGAVKAAPSGGPWIDTNAGFLRFLRAATAKPIWISNLPPAKTVIPVERYLQAIGDAAMSGARWVLAFDEDFRGKLLARDTKALDGWRRINQLLSFLEEHKEWREWPPAGQMAVIQDTGSGALLSGGVVDMVVVKHTPVRPVPYAKLGSSALGGAKMAVNVDPSALSSEQRDAVASFTRQGGTILSGPPGWKFPALKPGQITLEKQDVEKLEAIWKELNAMSGRRNLGARLFNVSSMLSNLQASPDGKRLILQMVNFSNYPAESITVHLLGKWTSVLLHAPGAKPRELAVYPVEDGTGVDVELVNSMAALVIQ